MADMNRISMITTEWVRGTAGNPASWSPPCDPKDIPDTLEEGDVFIQDHGDRLVMVEVAERTGETPHAQVRTIVNVLDGERYQTATETFDEQVFDNAESLIVRVARSSCAEGKSVRTIAFLRA